MCNDNKEKMQVQIQTDFGLFCHVSFRMPQLIHLHKEGWADSVFFPSPEHQNLQSRNT